jgi:hypothetical protein
MSLDLLSSLMNLQGGVATPQGQPILQGENPLAGFQGMPGATIPAATAAPAVSVNPSGRQVQSLEEMLFGIGGGLNG